MPDSRGRLAERCNAPPFSSLAAVTCFGVRIGALWIAWLAGAALSGCAATDGATRDSGAPAFVYSPYKYVPIALQRDSLAIATDGAALLVVSDGRSTLPDGVPALTLAFATGECGQEAWEGIDTDRPRRQPPGTRARRRALHRLDRRRRRRVHVPDG